MPRFCADCGAPIGAAAPVTCARCGAEHWRTASRGGAALVVHDGRLLLVRRAIEPWWGRWAAPGGFCDGPEHPADTAVRETLEETGVRVRVVGYLGHWVDEYRPGLDPQYCAVSYYHAVPEGSVELRHDPSEVSEAAWFAADELPDAWAPEGNGPRIYAAWRAAFLAGRLESPLPDL